MKEAFQKFLLENGYSENDIYYTIRNDGGQYLPCYVSRITVKDTLNTEAKIDKFIELAADSTRRGIMVFSVTKRDKNNKLFREVASQYEGVTITECKSRYHGDYKCWMICIPTE